MTKNEEIRKLLDDGEIEKALTIAKSLRMGDKNILSDIKRGYEALKYPNFYSQIGKDTKELIDKGVESLRKLIESEIL